MVDFCVNLLRRISYDLGTFVNEQVIPQSTVESLIVSLEVALRELIVVELTEGLSVDQRDGLEITRNCLSFLRQLQDRSNYTFSHRLQVTSDGRVGRPVIVIPERSLINLLENRFTVLPE